MIAKLKVVRLGVFIIAGLLIVNAGCGKSGPATTNPANTTTPVVTNPANTTVPKAVSTPGTENTLGDILGRATGVASVKYEMVMTAQGAQPITSKIWVKKNKMRTEMTQQGQSTVLLMDTDAKTMYSYMASQNIAMKMTYNSTAKSAAGEAQSIQNFNPKIVGTETIDGKVCTIVEYTVEGTTTKMWIWQDRGLPVKAEMTTATGKTIVEYKSYDFSDIPDNMFELPTGVKIMEMPAT